MFIRAYSRKYGHACNFQEKGKNMFKKKKKREKIFKNFDKNVQNLKIF